MRSAPVHLAIFDERQGGSEGDPSDQVLAYHPAEIPMEEQAGAVGLVRAVATFAHIFAGASPRPAHGRQVRKSFQNVLGPFSLINMRWQVESSRDVGLKYSANAILDCNPVM